MIYTGDNFLSVVVVTHNCGRFLGEFFGSWARTVEACAALRGGRPRVIVVDSGSTDDTVSRIRELMGEGEVMTLGNVGYGAAANAGMAAARSPWVLLCNADLSFAADFATRLVEGVWGAEKGELAGAAVIGPKLLEEDGTLQPSVGLFPTVGRLLRDQMRPRSQRKYVRHPPMKAGQVEWVSGACLLLRREAIKKVGGFDEKYFLYVEEVDLQYRLRQAGEQVWYLPEATVRHLQPNAKRPPRREMQRYAARGLLRFFAQHGTGGQLLSYRVLASLSGRIAWREAWRKRAEIIARATGP